MCRSRMVLTFTALLLFAAVFGVSAAEEKGLRLGLEFGNPNAVLIIRPAPFDFKIGYNFTEAGNLFLSADYRVLSKYPLVDVLRFFLSLGLYVQLHFVPTAVDLGARIPFGLQIYLIDDVLELFLELAPTIGFLPALTAFPEWQGYLGFTIQVSKR